MTWLWLTWALIGLGMELFTLFDATPNNTLTATIVTHVPAAWVLLGAAWVLAHFTAAVTRKGQQR